MLISRGTAKRIIAAVRPDSLKIDESLTKEWLLTNSRGGFSSGTIVGCNTRRYHSLLTGAMNPPANRVTALSNCLETVSFSGGRIELSSFEFDNSIHPEGYRYLTEFRRELGAHFDYNTGPARITKSIYLFPDSDAVAVVYEFFAIGREFDFSVRPLVALRDYHSLQKATATIWALWRDMGLVIRTEGADMPELFLRSDQMWFRQNSQWWYRFFYRLDHQRGQDCFEDLWSPGTFNCHIESPCRIILWAAMGPPESGQAVQLVDIDIDTVLDTLALREKELTENITTRNETLAVLHSAAGQFVVERQMHNSQSPAILAGFPWFLDWGRDTFISLPGLLLCTGRFDQAASILESFAHTVSEGMIPNRFDDYAPEAHYNSVDASLWFVHAAFEYLLASGDMGTFADKILPAITWIIDSYRRGTRFNIHADSDKLIIAGSADTQLTWMDAKYGGVAFTPRHGKAVEINALWYSNLCRLANYYTERNTDQHRYYADLAEQVKKSFRSLFWNADKGYLNDCILSDGTADVSIRPNQIFAVSLPYSPLPAEYGHAVVETVRKHLLTPYGLRTLAPDDPRYIGVYAGPQASRDAAYHNGTVWPYLMGPFIEAWLKVNHFSTPAKQTACEFLAPLIEHLTDTGCLGNISEIFDGDKPYNPRGCFAQAWSVGEVLRIYKMLLSNYTDHS